MKFDPTKTFGVVSGISSDYPGAKFQQGGFVYDAHHKCINPAEAKESSDVQTIRNATEELLKKKTDELAEITDSVVAAQKALNKDSTSANKSKLTKATNKYDALVVEIENIGG